MRGPFGVFFAVLFASALPALLAGCESLQSVIQSAPRPTARVAAVSLQNVTMDKINLVFTVEVSNPYSVSLPLLDLGYTIGSGGHQILSGAVKPDGIIPAHATQTIQLPTVVKFAPLMKTLKDVRPGSTVPYQADLTLGIDTPVVGRVELPFSKAGEFPVPAVPEVELVSFDVVKSSPYVTEATARLRLKNNNRFQLDLSTLRVEIALGGSKVISTRMARPAKLASGESVIVDMPLLFSTRALGSAVLALLLGDKASYSLSGWLDTGTQYGDISLPFNSSGSTRITN